MGENAEMETSLNLNISSISDTPEEGLNHDSEKKKKNQPFCETRERQCCPTWTVQAIKPGLDNEKSKRGSAKKQQSLPKKQVTEKKAPQNKKGQKKDNETISPVKSKRKTKVPAKFLDGIDFSKDVNTISLSVVVPFTVRPFLAPKGALTAIVSNNWSTT